MVGVNHHFCPPLIVTGRRFHHSSAVPLRLFIFIDPAKVAVYDRIAVRFQFLVPAKNLVKLAAPNVWCSGLIVGQMAVQMLEVRARKHRLVLAVLSNLLFSLNVVDVLHW
jgi:hypothetical protein